MPGEPAEPSPKSSRSFPAAITGHDAGGGDVVNRLDERVVGRVDLRPAAREVDHVHAVADGGLEGRDDLRRVRDVADRRRHGEDPVVAEPRPRRDAAEPGDLRVVGARRRGRAGDAGRDPGDVRAVERRRPDRPRAAPASRRSGPGTRGRRSPSASSTSSRPSGTRRDTRSRSGRRTDSTGRCRRRRLRSSCPCRRRPAAARARRRRSPTASGRGRACRRRSGRRRRSSAAGRAPAASKPVATPSSPSSTTWKRRPTRASGIARCSSAVSCACACDDPAQVGARAGARDAEPAPRPDSRQPAPCELRERRQREARDHADASGSRQRRQDAGPDAWQRVVADGSLYRKELRRGRQRDDERRAAGEKRDRAAQGSGG